MRINLNSTYLVRTARPIGNKTPILSRWQCDKYHQFGFRVFDWMIIFMKRKGGAR